MWPMKKKGPDMAAEAHGEETGGLAFHPMDQFIVKPFFGDGAVSWYTITNATVWMAVAVLAIFALLVLGTSKRSVIPSRMQSVAELAYGFIYKMVEDICGKEGVKYFPYIMTLFMFIVFSNFLGLLPMAFTPTSHISVTAVMAFAVFTADMPRRATLTRAQRERPEGGRAWNGRSKRLQQGLIERWGAFHVAADSASL